MIAVVDGAFSSVLTVFFYHAPFASLWQRVASTLLGPSALQGGSTIVLAGLVMHLGVALTWTIFFLILYETWPFVRRVTASPYGVLKVAAVYGPCIWMVMSLVVIRTLTGNPSAITVRWWVQFFGHIPFVAVPIVYVISRDRHEQRQLRSAH